MSEIKEQWQQDVADYGDNAFLMWKLTYKDKYSPKLDRNDDIAHHLRLKPEYPIVNRKDSAALPFDLERAKAGDVVEWMVSDDKWVDVENIIFLENGSVAVSSLVFGKSIFVDVDTYLRMATPPKATNESSEN